jgi:phage RecT family recombinase
MSKEGAQRILSMVDMCGSKEKKDIFIDTIKKCLPIHIRKPNAFVAMFESVVKDQLNNPYVTNKKSVISCIFQSVKFGLYPDPSYGHIYFIPYKGILTYQLGYRGMIQLMKNPGKIIDVAAHRIFDNDYWEFRIDQTGQVFKFVPANNHYSAKEILVCSFVTIKTNMDSDETKCFAHFIESERVDEIKKMVLQRTPKSPWANPLYEAAMRKKTVIRDHAKTLDCSPEMTMAISHEESTEIGNVQAIKEEIVDSIMDSVDVVDTEETQGDIMDNASKEFVKQL